MGVVRAEATVASQFVSEFVLILLRLFDLDFPEGPFYSRCTLSLRFSQLTVSRSPTP
jgi:hypothetical protein